MTALAWLFHNVVGHPVCGLLHFVGDVLSLAAVSRLGDAVHDLTCPNSTL